MRVYIIQILAAAVGSVGFGIIFKLKKKRLLSVAISGALTWAVYLVLYELTNQIFTANLVAAFFAAVISETMAHIFKAPSTIFLIPTFIALVPGGSLYYTMRAVLGQHELRARVFGIQTAKIAGALAFGILLFTAVLHIIHSFRSKKDATT